MTERWETVEAVNAARAAMEARLGWEQPVAWGLLTSDGAVVRANVRGGYLPAVALATVVGHRGGSSSYPLTASAIAEALALAEPAEACTEISHPNSPRCACSTAATRWWRTSRRRTSWRGRGPVRCRAPRRDPPRTPVTRFRVATPTARKYATQTAGGPEHLELWVPADELDAFNVEIVGEIEVVEEFSA